jgi:acetyl-CoA carboxylase biotin carboxyl carrier protein
MTNKEIRELLEIFKESGLAEMEVQRGENRLRLRRAPTEREMVVPAAAAGAVPPVAAQAPAGPSLLHPPVPAPSAGKPSAPDANEVLVKSPIVGTFYDAPSPGAPPFVKVGDRVEVGQVLCIIESMKLMNEIEAETAGIITAKLVENARPVEYGEALFSIRR